jgi:hypothetical protein
MGPKNEDVILWKVKNGNSKKNPVPAPPRQNLGLHVVKSAYAW